jgi:acyl-coenzyme A thioesterase PaaI-like protein
MKNSEVAEHVARASERALSIPFLVRCGYRLVEQREGHAIGSVHVSAELAYPSGHLNGTELYGLLDCTAFLAAATTLGIDEAAVTHDAHVSMLGTAPMGEDVTFEAKLMKRGRTTAFIRVDATSGGKPIALATITKTILPLAVRNRHVVPELAP